MLDRLVESRRARERRRASMAVSVVAHALVIGSLVFATARAGVPPRPGVEVVRLPFVPPPVVHHAAHTGGRGSGPGFPAVPTLPRVPGVPVLDTRVPTTWNPGADVSNVIDGSRPLHVGGVGIGAGDGVIGDVVDVAAVPSPSKIPGLHIRPCCGNRASRERCACSSWSTPRGAWTRPASRSPTARTPCSRRRCGARCWAHATRRHGRGVWWCGCSSCRSSCFESAPPAIRWLSHRESSRSR